MQLNPFKKKKVDVAPDRNIVDALANKLQKNGKIEELENELKKIRQIPLNKKELEAWHHLFGIAAFQRQDHEEAKNRFKTGLQKCPESQQIRFSLGQEFIFLGHPADAFREFDLCSFPQISRDFALAMSRYAYLNSEYERGIKYISPFFKHYLEVKILDDHFLYVRGLPFFGQAWNYLATHCILGNQIPYLKLTTEKIVGICHDYDFDFLNAELSAYATRDLSALLNYLKKRLEDTQKYNGPTGYPRLKIAIFESFGLESCEAALSHIDAIELGKEDFPWLEDIRLLAKAKIAFKFKAEELEDDYRRKFLSKQRLLFEPDHAISFGLLDYQEHLKPMVKF